MAGLAVITEACTDSLPDRSAAGPRYNPNDPNKGHDHRFFAQHSREIFAD